VRRTTILLVGAAAALAVALGSLFGGVFTESRSTGATAVPAADVAIENALAGFGRGGGTAMTVAKLEEELRSAPRDPDRLGSLGLAYQLRWRETGDPTFLPLSERPLERAVAIRPRYAAGTLGLGNLALIRHDFRAALAHGREARRLAPDASRPYGVIGDALLELGRYREAFAAFDRMVAVKPTLASYARIAYARELTGDRIGAISAMSLALDAIARSRTTSRRDTVQALFRTRRRRSVLGTYAIDPNGDTTLAAYGVFAIRHGALSLERRIASPG